MRDSIRNTLQKRHEDLQYAIHTLEKEIQDLNRRSHEITIALDELDYCPFCESEMMEHIDQMNMPCDSMAAGICTCCGATYVVYDADLSECTFDVERARHGEFDGPAEILSQLQALVDEDEFCSPWNHMLKIKNSFTGREVTINASLPLTRRKIRMIRDTLCNRDCTSGDDLGARGFQEDHGAYERFQERAWEVIASGDER